MQRSNLTKHHALLFASVSVCVLVIASSELARAADAPAPVVFKAPPVVAPGPQWEWFVEGAGFSTGGDPVWSDVPFFEARSFKPDFGWEGATGFNYRFANSPWHVSAQIRYGAAKADNRRFFQSGCAFFCSTSDATARHKERHWAADFMVGRDLAVGQGQHQLKLGVRVAELNVATDASGTSTFDLFGFASGEFTQRSHFRGIGPRVALEGSHPLGGAWSFDYGLGVALLFGDRDFALDGSGVILGIPIPSRIPPSDDNGKVYNLDAMGGLSYLFTPNFKFTAGYRFDGYWNAVHTWNSDLEFVNADRFFHGPFVRATARY